MVASPAQVVVASPIPIYENANTNTYLIHSSVWKCSKVVFSLFECINYSITVGLGC